MGIVREYIDFKKDQDPFDSLGIGRIQEREFAKLKLDIVDLLKTYDRLQPRIKREKTSIAEETSTHIKAGFSYYSRHWKTFIYYYIEASLVPWNINGVSQKGLTLTLYVGYKILEEGLNASQKKWTSGKIEECKPYLDKWIEEANEKHWGEGKVWESNMNFTRTGDVKQTMGIGREKLLGDFIEEQNKANMMNTFHSVLKMEDKPTIFKRAIKVSRPDIVRLLMSDPAIAAEIGNEESVKILMADDRVNPADNHNLALCNAAKLGHLEVVKTLLQDSRVNPADGRQTMDSKFNYVIEENYIILEAALKGNPAVVKELIKDPRVESTTDIFRKVFSRTPKNKDINKFPEIKALADTAWLLFNSPKTDIAEHPKKKFDEVFASWGYK